MSSERVSRRQLLLGRPVAREVVARPPGVSTSGLENCTGCGLCAERCPTGIIRMTDGLPFIDFASGECTFCGECKATCPEPVFGPVEIRHFPHSAVVTDRCLARNDVACQSCGESCPELAIRFRPRIGGPFTPEVCEDACSGCGACLSVCPVGAIALQSRALEAANV
ncbi:ferredoxin-type protein NapF [Rhizobium sp. BK313]|jgi:ferredoxin-type protein NapF|uniref:ferredoxin-type protein NapF n=1 Tax=Rhizobium sp. BK313 TaxID=2587081 RepID=UPI00105EEA10|nr:ferredoxin-type protein NapF [Rhizobium sp. BK313]MBB3452352.1 ferredoxin-type protein NapF [Rhizobium sp. BK313]